MAKPFLTARWTHLFLATYAVPQELLRPRLPPGLELDLRDGQAFASLVAFLFQDTRVWGIPWPGYRDFAELNLRCYVRHNGERGVMFLREIVWRELVALLARLIYNEPYVTAPLTGYFRENADKVTAEYRLTGTGREHLLAVTGSNSPYWPPENSVEHFFLEQRWGYGKSRSGRATRYRVVHPAWAVWPITDYRIDLDWGEVYGPEWKFLQGATPYSAIFALGSEVEVYPKGTL